MERPYRQTCASIGCWDWDYLTDEARRYHWARDLTYALLDAVDCDDWVVEVNTKLRRTLGECRYHSQTIVLSALYLRVGAPEDIEDTIRHEVAHAVAGRGTGHGPKWKEACVRLGARPKRTSRKLPDEAYRYVFECSSCGQVIWQRHRRPSKKLSVYESRCCQSSIQLTDKMKVESCQH